LLHQFGKNPAQDDDGWVKGLSHGSRMGALIIAVREGGSTDKKREEFERCGREGVYGWWFGVDSKWC
jgi:hypothetical protein